jgi:hypothetical protein
MAFTWNGGRLTGGGAPPRQNRIRQTRPALDGGFRPQPGQPGPGGAPPMGKDVYSSPAPPNNDLDGGAQAGGNMLKYGGGVMPSMRPISNSEGSGGQHVPIGNAGVDFNPMPMGGGQISSDVTAPGGGAPGMGGWFGGGPGGAPGGAVGFGVNPGYDPGGPAPMDEGNGNVLPPGRRPIGAESRGDAPAYGPGGSRRPVGAEGRNAGLPPETQMFAKGGGGQPGGGVRPRPPMRPPGGMGQGGGRLSI